MRSLDLGEDFFKLYRVSLDHFLDTFFRSNALAIEVLFGIVLAGVVFLTIRSFLRPENSNADVNLNGLEEGIKKILENYSGGATQPSGSDAAASDSVMEEMAIQIERLKIQLMQKTEEVEQLKANPVVESSVAESEPAPPPKASSSSGGESNVELEEKIRDLEARLSEYSIIEDDIADLSFYKEETVRLQAEIDKLKLKLAEYESSGPPPKFMAPPPASSAAPVATSVPESVENNTPSIPAADVPASNANASVGAPNSSDSFGSIDDDIMAEFERAVAEQKASSASKKVVTELSPAAFTPSTPSESNVPVANNEIKEEPEVPRPEPEASSTESTNSESTEVVVGDINLDKMLSEVSSLPDQDGGEIPNVLEQELDTDKLLKEATGMEKVDVDAINEFGEFIKKEGA